MTEDVSKQVSELLKTVEQAVSEEKRCIQERDIAKNRSKEIDQELRDLEREYQKAKEEKRKEKSEEERKARQLDNEYRKAQEHRRNVERELDRIKRN